MNPIEINYIFSAGFRCNSTYTLGDFSLRPFSGPFDYLFIDLETVFSLINTKLTDFLNNIVVFNKNKQQSYSINSLNELNTKNVCYMAHNYNNIDLRINTNFLDPTLSGNLYEWDRICIFHHHDILKPDIYNTIKRRIDRFNKIIENHSEKTCLFYITKILTIDNIQDYINNILKLKLMYSINSYIVIIVCADNLENAYYFQDNVLFIIKKVPPYRQQIIMHEGTDNNFNYTPEFNIIKTFFNFQLTPLTEL